MSHEFNEKNVNKLAGDLAGAAKIDVEDAHRVLKVLGIDNLISFVNTANEVVANDGARRALGISPRQPLTEINLDNLRIGVRGRDSFMDLVA